MWRDLPEKGEGVVKHPDGACFLLSVFVFVHTHLATGKTFFYNIMEAAHVINTRSGVVRGDLFQRDVFDYESSSFEVALSGLCVQDDEL